MRKFVVTDIHGCRETFKRLLEKVNFSNSDALFILGDCIDRGPDSKGVIDDIFKMEKNGIRVECLRGNHEDQMLLSRRDPAALVNWLRWGGKETLASFNTGERPVSIFDISEKYLTWFNALPYFLEEENYIMVHAGMNFLKKDPFNDITAMMWERNWYDRIKYKWLGDRIILHGHTPVSENSIKEMALNLRDKQYLNLDNGCFKTKPGQGQLCAFEMTEQRLFFQKRIEETGW